MITIKDFKKQYKTEIIEIVSLEMNENIMLLIGKNGSGKTTLLKALAGLITYQGKINFTGRPMYIEAMALYPEDVTALEYLKQLITIGDGSNLRLLWLIKEFQLVQHIKKPINALSKGMKQKVNLTQCFAENADLYLLDEPIEALDEQGRLEFINYLKNIKKPVICATHNPDAYIGLKTQKVFL